MPFTESVSNVSGRNSRASNISGATGASRSLHRSPPTSGPPNDTLASAGVLSMLKTSTDTGDIGALSFNSSRMPAVPGTTGRSRRGHASRPSMSAQHHPFGHNYATSQTSRVSSQWDTSSTQRRGSLTSMQSMPPSLPPVHTGKPCLAMMLPTPDGNPRDSRSYSMTSAPPPGQLPRHRSAASLKSQGHEPRNGHRMPQGPVPPMPENRPPYIYPTRLKRPGFRSPSPALSDSYAQGPMPGVPPMPRRGPGPHPPPMAAYNGYPSNYMGDFGQHLNVHPPRAANSSPGPGYGPAQYAYQQGSVRQPRVLGMPYPIQQPYPGGPPMQSPPGQYQQRPQQYGPHNPPRAGYPPYNQMPPQQQMRRGPPPPNVAPMAHQMFHNAARMARNIPQRSDTPMTDNGPPSSDPASASSAPDSSNPPTPKDHTTIRVVVDPAFIDPALVDLPDSSSEPVLPNAKYFEYADGLDKPMDDQEIDVPHRSVPPSGFVQRVKAMLESKAAAEAAANSELEQGGQLPLQQQYLPHYGQEMASDHDLEEISELFDIHELAANETPRFTIIEEFEAPVELPASPVKVAELDAAESTRGLTTRITREMIRAELGPSSIDNTLQQVQPDESTANVLAQLVEKGIDTKPPTPVQERQPQTVSHSRKSSRFTINSLKHRQDSVPEAITEVSTDASLPTGADYAMRFDTTVASDETQSKDPFALDADTITMQQQQSSGEHTVSDKPDHLEDGKKTPTLGRDSVIMDRTPISPLHPGEEVKRTSAVSPPQSDARGIDETLRLAVAGHQDSTITEEQSNYNSLAADDLAPPPTPRTPKTYSKSVQLRPSVTITDTNSTNSNRFSLPGDLSTVGDTTLNSASEMVTDMAVRFSLPQTTITIGKPQIIDVSAGSTPDKARAEPTFAQQLSRNQGLKSSRRSSVTFADEIAPLNISKKPEPMRSIPEAKCKSIIRKPSPCEDTTSSSSRDSRESTTDLRVPSNAHAAGLNARFGSTHLPGLKEESIEDMSISDHKRSTDMGQLQLPARIAAVKAMQERRLQESADKAKVRRQARQHNRPLADTRDLPSLNFSRVDLIDKLNNALKIKPTKSMEMMRRRDFSEIYCPSPQRPLSTEPLRERYTSFFCKPEEFSFLDQEQDSDEEREEPEQGDCKALVPTVQIQENTQIEDEHGQEHGQRPLSPEDFLQVATQINRLSIPSINGLSDRISELIPGLRNLQNLNLQNYFATDSGEMHPGYPGNEGARPDTVLTTRTSAGFRTLAERAEEIVMNGTHDSLALRRSLNKDLPALPGSASTDMFSGANSSESRSPYLSGSVSMPIDLGKDLTPASSAMLRGKAPMTEAEVARLLPAEMNPITRMANKRSMILSQPSSRPWNVDQNYPWSETKLEIDLSVPLPAHTRRSFADEVLRERRTKSLDLTQPAPTKGDDTTMGIDIGSITTSHPGSPTSVTTEQLTGVTPQHLRKQSKRSIIGSITRKFGLSSVRNTAVDEDTTVKNTKSPVPRAISAAHSTHKPGDRYPTSSLTPPANFALDEVRSFFSDNSSERDRTASFRKRLTHFKGKGKSTRIGSNQQRAQSLDGEGATEYNAGSINEARIAADGSANTFDANGMSKTEFHIKRFGEKLRHMFAKAGELARTWSTRTKHRRGGRHPQDEWLADSLYSGV